jgi:transposase
LQKYSPDFNPIERVWWHFRKQITRNHTCQTLPELVDRTLAWLEYRKTFVVENQP